MQKELLKINNYIENKQRKYFRYRLEQEFNDPTLKNFIRSAIDNTGLLNYQNILQLPKEESTKALYYIANNINIENI